jgi:hypothetical protein
MRRKENNEFIDGCSSTSSEDEVRVSEKVSVN